MGEDPNELPGHRLRGVRRVAPRRAAGRRRPPRPRRGRLHRLLRDQPQGAEPRAGWRADRDSAWSAGTSWSWTCRRCSTAWTLVFHLAAQAGVRPSWGSAFQVYSDWNILATQRLLEAARRRPLRRFVYASSSAVYGRSTLPLHEEGPTRPLSPYGVSKLAAEHLCGLYAEAYGVPTVSLRYFTVYGPRQRPDMAFHRFIRALRAGRPIPVFGDGRQTRDFTFVGDIVDATCQAADAAVPAGTVLNVAGGSRIELGAAIEELAQVTGRPARLEPATGAPGEMPHTYADIRQAAERLGWRPKTALAEGLREEIAWVARLEAAGAFPESP